MHHTAFCALLLRFRYVDISDSIYPDRYITLIKEQQLIKVRCSATMEGSSQPGTAELVTAADADKGD